jgi:hypothetical protein
LATRNIDYILNFPSFINFIVLPIFSPASKNLEEQINFMRNFPTKILYRLWTDPVKRIPSFLSELSTEKIWNFQGSVRQFQADICENIQIYNWCCPESLYRIWTESVQSKNRKNVHERYLMTPVIAAYSYGLIVIVN